MIRRKAQISAFLLAAASPTLAQTPAADAPLSAIDWLSNSLTDTPPLVVRPPEPPVTNSAGVEQITVVALDKPSPDGLGLMEASDVGLRPGLWGPSSPEDLARRISSVPQQALPAVQSRFRDVLTARLDPPRGAGQPGVLFLSRVDALLGRGAVPKAGRLLAQADSTRPEHFRRAFDIALLTGDEAAGCDRLRATPGIAPSFSVRIFCLARNGDWSAAALTLETAQALGQVSPDEDLLLARFLDAEIAEATAILALPPNPTPLSFRMLEAIGDGIPTSVMPLAFAHSDLRPVAGWKPRLEAAERLARAGALSPSDLFAIYGEREAAASGGVWERVAAVAELQQAIASGDARGAAHALPSAWQEMRASGLAIPFAEQYGPALHALDLRGDAGTLADDIALLSQDYESVAASRSATTTDPAARLPIDIARGQPPEPVPGAAPLPAAIAQAFSDTPPPVPPDIAATIDSGEQGLALLDALARLAPGAEGDPADIAEALVVLRRLGQEDTARRAALQMLLLGPGA